VDYQIKPIDISKKDELRKVNFLLRATFGDDIADDKLAKTTKTNSSQDSLYLAAIKDGEVIGFNAFISHDLILNGSLINCYQSCWIATVEAHRGSRVFQNLSNTAKEMLSERDAAFIFCFPNENSRPIFIQKLGFREVPSLKWQVPNIPIVRDRYVNRLKTGATALTRNVIFQNGRQLIDLKRNIYNGELLLLESGKSYLWGVRRNRKKLGVNMQYFEIGGMFIDDPTDLGHLFDGLRKKIEKVSYFQLTTSVGSPYNQFFNNLKPAQTNDLIVFDLKLCTTGDLRFNFFGGVKDVF